MAKIIASVVIRRPIEEVFAFVNNFAAYPQWQSGVIAAKKVSDGPLGVGSRIVETRRLFGKTTEMAWEMTDFQPPRVRGFKMEGAFPSTGAMTWEAIPGGTRLQVEVTTHTRGFFKLLEPFLVPIIQQQNARDFATLKQLLESDPVRSNAQLKEAIL